MIEIRNNKDASESGFQHQPNCGMRLRGQRDETDRNSRVPGT